MTQSNRFLLFQVRFALMPPEVSYEVDDEKEENGGMPNTNMHVDIESSGQVANPMTEKELYRHYDGQLPNFPEGCQHNVRSFLGI